MAADGSGVNSPSQCNWQQEIEFRLDLLRLAAGTDQRSPEEAQHAELLAQLVRHTQPPDQIG